MRRTKYTICWDPSSINFRRKHKEYYTLFTVNKVTFFTTTKIISNYNNGRQGHFVLAQNAPRPYTYGMPSTATSTVAQNTQQSDYRGLEECRPVRGVMFLVYHVN